MEPDIRDLWGKTADNGSFHPLICHLLDSGGVAGAMWDMQAASLRMLMSEAFGLEQEDFRRWLGFWTSLHDLGKATPGFQSLGVNALPDLADRLGRAGLSLTPRGSDPFKDLRHGQAGTVLIRQVFNIADMPFSIPAELAGDIATVLGGHHGAFPLASELIDARRKQAAIDDPWQTCRLTIVDHLCRFWGIGDLPRPVHPPCDKQAALMVLAGLVSVADWIASAEDSFPPAGRDIDIEQYEHDLPEMARKALAIAHWQEVGDVDAATSFEQVFGIKAPYDVQVQAARLAKDMTCPGLILIEAPMGMGKTEAALEIARQCLCRLGQQGIYIALPTQATSNEMLKRFQERAPQMIGSNKPINLHLVHGQAMLNEQYLKLRHVGQDENLEARVMAAEWFATSKRGLLAPFSVGTIDQGLFSILQTRHFFVRLYGLAGKVVILDEVHAYDAYTSGLMEQMLRWLGRMNCTVVLLSATLPSHRRQKLLDSYAGRTVEIADAPYPRISLVSGDKAKPLSVSVWPGPSKTVTISLISRDPQEVIAQRLLEALSGGGCAACICNTVARAQGLYETIKNAAPSDCEVDLVHARYLFKDRQDREKRAIEKFGKDGWSNQKRPAKAILVATQVIEQSLDLDFDLMVTDLAPIDLIFQRAGRLHRHTALPDVQVRRPASLSQPQLWIAAPRTDHVPDFGPDEYVYERYLLLQTYLSLFAPQLTGLCIPDDIERLVEVVYREHSARHPDEAWQEALEQAWFDLDLNRRRYGYEADSNSIVDPDDPDGVLNDFNAEYGDDEGLSASISGGTTRKAEPSVRLICLHDRDGRSFLDAEGGEEVRLDAVPSHALLLEMMKRSVTLADRRIVQHFRGCARPSSWQRCPLLRHAYPMLLRGKRYMAGSVSVQLEDELGVVVK